MKIIVFIKDIDTKEHQEYFVMAAREIIGEAKKMKPYISLLHTEGSNIVDLDVRWKSSEVFPNLRKLQQLENVQGFLTFHDPLGDLDKAVSEHDFFKAYSLGCTYFESVGLKILKRHFENNNRPMGSDFRPGLFNTIVMLYSHGLIEEKVYQDLIKINKIRNNDLIHWDITERPSFDRLEKIIQPMDKIPECARILQSKLEEK